MRDVDVKHMRSRSLVMPEAASSSRAGERGSSSSDVWFLDYGAGNVRSVRNAAARLGYTVRDVESFRDIERAEKLLFPGVGAFGNAMQRLRAMDCDGALREYILSGRAFLGICVGMQVLFDGSDEFGGEEGLGVVPGRVSKFDFESMDPTRRRQLHVPHIGWNSLHAPTAGAAPSLVFEPAVARSERAYFVHSFRATPCAENEAWIAACANYGGEFVAAVRRGAVHATQFHPEKSSAVGLALLDRFLSASADDLAANVTTDTISPTSSSSVSTADTGVSSSLSSSAAFGLSKRLIACMDVRSNDAGELVVTKGDQYDVREKDDGGKVRDLGQPVALAQRYFEEGADEVTFLNITGFRDFPLGDMPMLQMMRDASERCFVPLTVGGGIRSFTDKNGRYYSALEVAAEYFRSGADKVSIGSDAVASAIAFLESGGERRGDTSIEQISEVYGAQAVVVSIDPRRVYVQSPEDVRHATVKTATPGPNGEEYCWFQCTIKGGREGADLGAVELATAVEALGAGEILLNCIDRDGQNSGFDTELVRQVSDAVSIPVIASSGAGNPTHFTEVFEETFASAALAAGIFHRREVSIADVKETMQREGIPTRSTR